MAQESFTTAGVEVKIAELYALSDVELLQQADWVRSDLAAWVVHHFTLDTAQQAHLDLLSEGWKKAVSCQLGFALENRVPVTLDKEPSAASADTTTGNTRAIAASKLLGFENNMTVGDRSGILEVYGSLDFFVEY